MSFKPLPVLPNEDDKSPPTDLVVQMRKWRVGPPHKPTNERTLRLYRDAETTGLSGGGESLRYPGKNIT